MTGTHSAAGAARIALMTTETPTQSTGMKANFSMAPEIARLACAPPPPVSAGASPPTVGTMAMLLREVAACPARWLPLARFDTGARTTRQVASAGGYDARVVVTPPGYQGRGGSQQAAAEVFMLVQGQLIEHALFAAGITRRHLVPGKVVVHGGYGRLYETANSGPGYAVALHVTSA